MSFAARDFQSALQKAIPLFSSQERGVRLASFSLFYFSCLILDQ
jgi:hypothetical protein